MDMMPAPSGFTFASPSAQPLAADLVAMLPPGSRVLVTGAAGFIGSHLADQLLCRGYHVVGLDCFTDYYPTGLKRRNLETAFDYDGFTLVEDDLVTTEQSLVTAVQTYLGVLRDQWQATVDIANLLQTPDLFASGEEFPVAPIPALGQLGPCPPR